MEGRVGQTQALFTTEDDKRTEWCSWTFTMRFADLERKEDAKLLNEQNSSLMQWYRAVRNVAIADLELGDLCRALRQRLFIAHVLPIALAQLEADVMAGDDYDGQLVSSLKALEHSDWSANAADASRAQGLLRGALDAGQLTKDIASDINYVLAAISSDQSTDF